MAASPQINVYRPGSHGLGCFFAALAEELAAISMLVILVISTILRPWAGESAVTFSRK